MSRFDDYNRLHEIGLAVGRLHSQQQTAEFVAQTRMLANEAQAIFDKYLRVPLGELPNAVTGRILADIYWPAVAKGMETQKLLNELGDEFKKEVGHAQG